MLVSRFVASPLVLFPAMSPRILCKPRPDTLRLYAIASISSQRYFC